MNLPLVCYLAWVLDFILFYFILFYFYFFFFGMNYWKKHAHGYNCLYAFSKCSLLEFRFHDPQMASQNASINMRSTQRVASYPGKSFKRHSLRDLLTSILWCFPRSCLQAGQVNTSALKERWRHVLHTLWTHSVVTGWNTNSWQQTHKNLSCTLLKKCCKE